MNYKTGKFGKKECIKCGKETTNVKFCSNQCQQDHNWEQRKKKIKKTGISYERRAGIRYLNETEGHKCKICGIDTWEGKDITLIMDHIDGNSKNDHLTNLRLICPNCDSQLPTYKSRNMGKGRFSRKKRYAEGKSY